MSVWILIQVVIDIVLVCSLVIQARKMMRPPKDDPRLSRGLQLLQSKIAVLEDLSDRTDVQVKQLLALLEQKTKDVQSRICEAEHHIQLVKRSMEQSLEVAQIFQDKIPHQEIIERQNTKKYIQAAQMAHEGRSVDEIAKVIDLPRGELELISKINRDRLVFAEDQLPAWATTPVPTPAPAHKSVLASSTAATTGGAHRVFEATQSSPLTLEKLSEEFRKARAKMEMPTLAPRRDETSPLVNRFTSTKLFQKAAQILDAQPAGSVPSNAPDSSQSDAIHGENPAMSDEEVRSLLEEAYDHVQSTTDVSPAAATAPAKPRGPQIKPFEFKKINLSDTLG